MRRREGRIYNVRNKRCLLTVKVKYGFHCMEQAVLGDYSMPVRESIRRNSLVIPTLRNLDEKERVFNFKTLQSVHWTL